MMAQVILLQPQPETALHWKMVRCVMEHVVTDITEDETGKHTRCQRAENKKEKKVKQNRKRNAYARRHDQPPSVIWIIVMYAMNNVVQLFSQTALRFVMEYTREKNSTKSLSNIRTVSFFFET